MRYLLGTVRFPFLSSWLRAPHHDSATSFPYGSPSHSTPPLVPWTKDHIAQGNLYVPKTHNIIQIAIHRESSKLSLPTLLVSPTPSFWSVSPGAAPRAAMLMAFSHSITGSGVRLLTTQEPIKRQAWWKGKFAVFQASNWEGGQTSVQRSTSPLPQP